MPPLTFRQLQKILFLDIETVSCVSSYEELSGDFQALWDKKAASIQTHENTSTDALFFERAGIYAEFGKIIVIGLGFLTFDEGGTPTLRTKSLQNHDEKALLCAFKEILTANIAHQELQLCAHNGKEFDFPYLCRRMIVHGMALPPVLDLAGKKPWEVPHLDTMALWQFGDRKSFTSLHLLATLLDIPSSKEIMHGHEVNHYYYHKNDLHKIAEYCRQDVVVTAQLFLKMHHHPLVCPQHIIQV